MFSKCVNIINILLYIFYNINVFVRYDKCFYIIKFFILCNVCLEEFIIGVGCWCGVDIRVRCGLFRERVGGYWWGDRGSLCLVVI